MERKRGRVRKREKQREKERVDESMEEREGKTSVLAVRISVPGTMEPSNLLRWPRAPFNETRLMQLIDHLGMH